MYITLRIQSSEVNEEFSCVRILMYDNSDSHSNIVILAYYTYVIRYVR